VIEEIDLLVVQEDLELEVVILERQMILEEEIEVILKEIPLEGG
jgi:hypothetical protein